MLICPGIEVKAVKAHPLVADGEFHQVRPHITLKDVLAHAQVGRRVPIANEPGKDGHGSNRPHPGSGGVKQPVDAWMASRIPINPSNHAENPSHGIHEKPVDWGANPWIKK